MASDGTSTMASDGTSTMASDGTRDKGVATVEFALLLGVMLLLVALVWPLGDAFMQKMRLERATTDVIRYATATPNTPAYDPDGGAVSRRPTCQQVEREFYRAYGIGSESTSDFTFSIPVCPNNLVSGQTVTVRITKTTNLGPFGSLLDVAGITHSSSITVSAAASGREE